MRDDEKAALKAQVREIEAFLTTVADEDTRTATDEALAVDLVMAQFIRHLKGEKRKRGRPDIFESNDPRTINSWRAFRFVQREKQYFRKRVGRVRVPKEAADCFVDYALRLYPAADLVIFDEYMRTIKKVPIEEEFRTENWRTVNYERDKLK